MKAYQEFAIDYFQDEDGIFTARVPAIKGCIAWGETLEAAYRNAVDAIESCLEARERVSALKLRKPQCLSVIPELNPKGIPPQSPGLRAASYPGKSRWCRPTPTGLWPEGADGAQPRWG